MLFLNIFLQDLKHKNNFLKKMLALCSNIKFN